MTSRKSKRNVWRYGLFLLLFIALATGFYFEATNSDDETQVEVLTRLFEDTELATTNGMLSPADFIDVSEVEYQAVTVIDVLDGDTIVIGVGSICLSGEGNPDFLTMIPVRLIGIDAPEMGFGSSEYEIGATEATEYARELLPLGARGYMQICPVRPQDVHERTRAYIWLASPTLDITNPKEHLFQARMLAAGHARVMIVSGDSTIHEDLFNELEAQAQAAGLGKWGR